MASSKSKAWRLRVAAGVALAVALMAAVVLGSAFPAAQTGNAVTGAGTVDWTQAPRGTAAGSFNWLFFLLVLGPGVVASAVLVSAAEVVQSVSRRSRSGRIREGGDIELP